MKALILGMPGSGTSYYAGLLSALGWSDASPTFARARYGYPTHESLMGRAVNRIAIGRSDVAWPVTRWYSGYELRSINADPEVHALAEHFVSMNEAEGSPWYFKNPESLMFYRSLWARFDWDHVIGVYRHPVESVKTLSSRQPRSGRRQAWLKWTGEIISASSVLVRFPQDADRLCAALGVAPPEGFGLARGKPRSRSTEDIPRWAKGRWEVLENARCQDMTKVAT